MAGHYDREWLLASHYTGQDNNVFASSLLNQTDSYVSVFFIVATHQADDTGVAKEHVNVSSWN